MSLPPIQNALNAYQNTATHQTEPKKAQAESQSVGVQGALTEVTVRNEKQAVFVSHFFTQSDDKAEGSLKITYQMAVDKLNERLEEETGEKNVISAENLKKQGGMEYWTPENVAQRIVSGTTGFLDGFKKVHPELEGEALIDRFLNVVGGGVKQGFDQAQSILKELDVFEGTVSENYDKTYDLVQKGFEAFRRQQLGLPPLESASENSSAEEGANKGAEISKAET